MRCRTLLAGSLGVAVVAVGASATSSQTVLERILDADQLCRGLATNTPFGTIGVEQLKDVRIPAADISLRGDVLTISLDGSLACESSSAALIAGDASASFSTRADIDLGTCTARDVFVTMTQFGGTFGIALQQFSSQIEAALSEKVLSALTDTCIALNAAAEKSP